jgi:hypothetical protein
MMPPDQRAFSPLLLPVHMRCQLVLSHPVIVITCHDDELKVRVCCSPSNELSNESGFGDGSGMHEITEQNHATCSMARDEPAQAREIRIDCTAGNRNSRTAEDFILAEMEVGQQQRSGTRPQHRALR